jgi:hypothetical protein
MAPADPLRVFPFCSRERNRMHARKTRQRKKAHMTELSKVRKDLEEQQRQLKQAISERKTAKILLVMSASARGITDGPSLLALGGDSDDENRGVTPPSGEQECNGSNGSTGSGGYQEMDCDNHGSDLGSESDSGQSQVRRDA